MLTTVLIIDKRRELPAKYKKCIDSKDVNAVIARNLKDGIASIQSLEPDMIIVSDSIEESLADFCGRIRALTYNTRPVIIALSKSAESADRIKVLESGADDFLSEPVNIDEFKTRIMAHLRRDVESNLDTRTLLPNYKYVKKALKRALVAENNAVLLAGIENLEDYKAVYTELAADKLVQTFVAIVKSALDDTDFIGQVDEYNFVIITNKFSAEKLASFLVFAFDTVVPKFYSENDAKRGYMLMKGERYAGMRANFASLLIGGIAEGIDRIASVEALMNKLASIKALAKIPTGSNYAFERTKLTAADSVLPNQVKRNVYVREADDSLKYLIRTALELQGYDVQDNLDMESAEQPSIIIMDSGNDLGELEFLRQIKNLPTFVNTKVIVTTTHHDKSVILDSGADLYLPKPYEISDLLRWVEYFLKK